MYKTTTLCAMEDMQNCPINHLPVPTWQPKPLSWFPLPCALLRAGEGRVLVELTKRPIE